MTLGLTGPTVKKLTVFQPSVLPASESIHFLPHASSMIKTEIDCFYNPALHQPRTLSGGPQEEELESAELFNITAMSVTKPAILHITALPSHSHFTRLLRSWRASPGVALDGALEDSLPAIPPPAARRRGRAGNTARLQASAGVLGAVG